MRRYSVALLVPFIVTLAAVAGPAIGNHTRAADTEGFSQTSSGPPDRPISHGLTVGPDDGGGKSHLYQHGPLTGHLPGSSENVDLLSKLRLTQFEGDISDVSALRAKNKRLSKAVLKLAKFEGRISRPRAPRQVGFLESPGFGYVTEGVQALRVRTSKFKGDILVISNEWCQEDPDPRLNPGGITIWDITRPTQPELLVEAFGDFDVLGDRANESHSAIAWDAGRNAYVAAIDNYELEDVDLFDITDPRNPVKVAETRLPGVRVNGYGQEKTSHDFDVLRFPDRSWHLMVSDWDAGWIVESGSAAL